MEEQARAAKMAESVEWILGPRDGERYPAMPTEQVHLFAGASGVGKSTLLLQMVLAIKEGKPFFGYPTRSLPVLYISYDRDHTDNDITMERVGLEPDDLPSMMMEVQKPPLDRLHYRDQRFEDDMRMVLNAQPDAKLVIIDGFYTLVPNGSINDYLTVAEFMQRCRRFCQAHGITIIGVAHSPKQWTSNKVTDPRQMIFGSVAGGGFSCFNVVLLREDDDPKNGNRAIHFLPRNSPEHRVLVGMTEHGLSPESYIPKESKELGRPRGGRWGKFMEILQTTVSPGQRFTMQDLIEPCLAHDISRSSANQWLSEMVAKGEAERVAHGEYLLV